MSADCSKVRRKAHDGSNYRCHDEKSTFPVTFSRTLAEIACMHVKNLARGCIRIYSRPQFDLSLLHNSFTDMLL